MEQVFKIRDKEIQVKGHITFEDLIEAKKDIGEDCFEISVKSDKGDWRTFEVKKEEFEMNKKSN